jgi:hypothetical protein
MWTSKHHPFILILIALPLHNPLFSPILSYPILSCPVLSSALLPSHHSHHHHHHPYHPPKRKPHPAKRKEEKKPTFSSRDSNIKGVVGIRLRVCDVQKKKNPSKANRARCGNSRSVTSHDHAMHCCRTPCVMSIVSPNCDGVAGAITVFSVCLALLIFFRCCVVGLDVDGDESRPIVVILLEESTLICVYRE